MGKTCRISGGRGLARVAVATMLMLASWAMCSLGATATATAATDSPQASASQLGVYRIVNVASHSSLRAYEAGSPIFVSSTRENPGPFELWEITRVGEGYTIKNVGLSHTRGSDAYASVSRSEEGEPVITDSEPTTWAAEQAGDGTYVIKAPHEDLVWNVEPPVVPRGEVALRGADGSDTQRWRFEPVNE
ncbi:hypothetical protein ACFQ08_13855 [Streptosporangium algeriense]|uniref:Ricin B lectin domain-containing protein n=1 Tax=Streptosporangium algeriense TaxID=1682748 RepID=A0ABW3DP89_9ACTN